MVPHKSLKVNSAHTILGATVHAIDVCFQSLPRKRQQALARRPEFSAPLLASLAISKHLRQSKYSRAYTARTSSPSNHPDAHSRCGTDGKASLLLFSALGTPPFRTVKLRSRKPTCLSCGKDGEKVGTIAEIDYVAFCGGQRPDWTEKGMVDANSNFRIQATVSCIISTHRWPSYSFLQSWKDLKDAIRSDQKLTLIDVRSRTEFGICHLPGSTSQSDRRIAFSI